MSLTKLTGSFPRERALNGKEGILAGIMAEVNVRVSRLKNEKFTAHLSSVNCNNLTWQKQIIVISYKYLHEIILYPRN